MKIIKYNMWQFLVLIILFSSPCFAQKPKFVFEEPDRIDLLTFSKDGKMLAVVTSRGSKVYNTESGKLKGKLDTNWYSNSAIFSNDGKRLMTGHNDGKVRLWDTQTFAELKTLSITKWSIYNLAISPDDKTLAIDAADGTIELWNIQNGEKFGTLGSVGQRMKSMRFTHNGNFLATINLDGELTLWNIKTKVKAFSIILSSD